MNKTLVAVAVLGVLSLAPVAVADTSTTPIHLKTTATCTTAGGSTIVLLPGYYLSEDLWVKLDRETRRLQDLETRLTVENKSLKASLNSKSGVLSLLSGVVLGITAGKLIL